MRALADFSGTRILSRDSGGRCGVEGTSEAAVDRQRLGNWRRQLGQREARADRFSLARYSLEDDTSDEAALRINGNCSDSMPRPASRCDEMQWLTRHRATNRDDRISWRCWGGEREPHDGTRIGTRGCNRESRGLRAKRS